MIEEKIGWTKCKLALTKKLHANQSHISIVANFWLNINHGFRQVNMCRNPKGMSAPNPVSQGHDINICCRDIIDDLLQQLGCISIL